MQPFGNIILPGESRRRQKFYLSKAKLSHVAQLSSFMAAFGIRSVVNLQISKDADENILTLYVVITSLLVATSSFVILTAMWVLPLLKTSEQINNEILDVLEAQPPEIIRAFNLQEFTEKLDKITKPGGTVTFGLKSYRTTPGTIRLVEIAWILAGTVSVFLFTVDVIAINWVKFQYFTWIGALVGTIVLVIVLVGLAAFGLYFRLYFVRKFRNIGKKVINSEVISYVKGEMREGAKDANKQEYENTNNLGVQLNFGIFFSCELNSDNANIIMV